MGEWAVLNGVIPGKSNDPTVGDCADDERTLTFIPNEISGLEIGGYPITGRRLEGTGSA